LGEKYALETLAERYLAEPKKEKKKEMGAQAEVKNEVFGGVRGMINLNRSRALSMRGRQWGV